MTEPSETHAGISRRTVLRGAAVAGTAPRARSGPT